MTSWPSSPRILTAARASCSMASPRSRRSTSGPTRKPATSSPSGPPRCLLLTRRSRPMQRNADKQGCDGPALRTSRSRFRPGSTRPMRPSAQMGGYLGGVAPTLFTQTPAMYSLTRNRKPIPLCPPATGTFPTPSNTSWPGKRPNPNAPRRIPSSPGRRSTRSTTCSAAVPAGLGRTRRAVGDTASADITLKTMTHKGQSIARRRRRSCSVRRVLMCWTVDLDSGDNSPWTGCGSTAATGRYQPGQGDLPGAPRGTSDRPVPATPRRSISPGTRTT